MLRLPSGVKLKSSLLNTRNVRKRTNSSIRFSLVSNCYGSSSRSLEIYRQYRPVPLFAFAGALKKSKVLFGMLRFSVNATNRMLTPEARANAYLSEAQVSRRMDRQWRS
jgi:hypothetical protein